MRTCKISTEGINEQSASAEEETLMKEQIAAETRITQQETLIQGAQ
jgi:hypothetical protein